eukprot:TRINITY_DN4762_c0_g1_i2.p1 TRINITY_DN4762_c0_g1~~TRINITY_DN4762_c0_g1_i2.p1  ORF type:complete len:392 (-),score=62.47 TRINITY_DN4762_c0_g1_i2:155-1183(-)
MMHRRPDMDAIRENHYITSYQHSFKPPQFDRRFQINGMSSLTPRGGRALLMDQGQSGKQVGAAPNLMLPKKKRSAAVSLGVIRLDYDYPPAPGDIDSPESFDYDVFYRVVPGFTFKMCQSGKMTPAVEEEFKEALKYLIAQGVGGITGDCGFMMYWQKLARSYTKIPIFMSSLAQLPAVTCAFSRDEKIGIFTANSKTLEPMRDLIRDECGVDTQEKRYIIVGCQDVPGFEAVANGTKVDVPRVTPGIVALVRKTLGEHPDIRAILMECTELGPYSDAVRQATGLPVFDAITCCNFFTAGKRDNERFGINNWQEAWDHAQENYTFGSHLDAADRAKLVNKIQ